MNKLIKKSSLVCGLFFSIITLIISASPGHIIILHGFSSTGKTSINHELALLIGQANTEILSWGEHWRTTIRQKAKEICLFLDEDKYQWWELWVKLQEQIKEPAATNFYIEKRGEFFEKIKKIALSNKIVLIDTLETREIPLFLESVKDIKVNIVLIYTPLHQVIKFIESRNNSTTGILNKRSLLISMKQYQVCFKPSENEQDIIVDTLNRNDVQKYFDLINKESRWYTDKPENFEQNFMQHFNLDKKDLVKITPVTKYDTIIYHSELSAAERARFLKNALKI